MGDRRNLDEDVAALIARFRGRLADGWVDEYVSLAVDNEYGVALENLCVQLYEFDIVPTGDELTEIGELFNAMGMSVDLLDEWDVPPAPQPDG